MYEPQWVCEGKGSEEMKALKRAHIMILATVFTLLVGGTLAFANGFVGGGNDAHGAVVTTSQHNGANNNSESNTGKTSSDTQQQQQQTSSEPTATTAPVTASTAKPSVWAGKIASVDCTNGTSRPGIHGWWLTEKVSTSARPDTASTPRSFDQHLGQITPGGWR